MPDNASDLARRLARDAEAVCRHYLPAGRREGRYWLVGDVENSPGRSLYVRLRGPESGKGAAGKWTDASPRHTRAGRLPRSRATTVGDLEADPRHGRRDVFPHSRDHGFAGLHVAQVSPALLLSGRPGRRPDVRTAWPALIAAVTDLSGTITGVHRTWLDLRSGDKAPVVTPRRAMGNLLGHGVRLGRAPDTMAAGEGIETILSLRQIAPNLPAVASLSAAHLAALILPPTCKRLYIAEDADPAGRNGADQLAGRAEAAGIEALRLRSTLGDLNEDLARLGHDAMAAALRIQFAPEDVTRFLLVDGTAAKPGRAA